MSTVDGQVCPYLGRCDDAESYYAFATANNCCHSEKRLFRVETSYQANTCLERGWTACPRYKTATGAAEADNSMDVTSLPGEARSGLPRWAIIGIVGVVCILLVALLLLLRSQSKSQPSAVSAADLAPGQVGTLAVELPSTLPGQTSATNAADEPSPTVVKPTPVPSLLPTSTKVLTRTPSPTSTRMPTTTPSRTPTRTPSPTPSRTSTPTPSLTPTRTPTATPSRTPTRTPSPTRAPTRRPAPTSTPLSTPALLAPSDGQHFSGKDEIILSWQSVGQLPADGYYVPMVAYSHYGDTWHDEVPWTKDTSWRLSEHIYLLDLSDDGLYRWSVQVMRQTGVDGDGNPSGEPLSGRSDEWTVKWLRASGDSGDGSSGPPTNPTPSIRPAPTVPPP
jgi:hypothetical protein